MEQRADYLMFGGVASARQEPGVRFGLFDRAKGTTTVMEHPTRRSLDLFEA
jgi:hypothetical protein